MGYLTHAIELALTNPYSGHLPRMGAVLANRGGLLGVGYNRLKSHPLQAKFSGRPGAIYLHAEIDAVVSALRDFSMPEIEGSTLYVARVLKNGQPGLAKPCPGCQRAIMHFGIANVEWTT